MIVSIHQIAKHREERMIFGNNRTRSFYQPRTLLLWAALMLSAQMPGSLWGQTWQACGTGSTCMATGNVGVGTTNPSQTLHVVGKALFQNTGTAAPFISDRTDGKISAFGAGGTSVTLAYDNTGIFKIESNDRATISAGVFGTGATTRFVVDSSGVVGIGTSAPQCGSTATQPCKLSVNGAIGTKEIVVTNTGWADYVFAPSYRLKQLSEVGEYIKEHHRLPDLPSEKEVQESGVSLGDMQVKLLAKIEELTLHMIELDKQNKTLQAKVTQLQEQVQNVYAVARQIAH